MLMSLRLIGNLKRILTTVIVAMAAAYAAPSSAAVIIGRWDPSFGAAFPDLGWRGEATFFVPDACLAKSGWVFNFESCSNFGMKILSADVEFYKVSDPTNPAFQEAVAFHEPSSVVERMNIENGVLAGLFGSFDYSVPSTLPLAGGPYTEFVLFFEDNIARMGFISNPPDGDETRGRSDANAFITFRVVPEPSSLALAVIALLTTFAAVNRSYRRTR